MKKLIALCLILTCILGTALAAPSDADSLESILSKVDSYDALYDFIIDYGYEISCATGNRITDEIDITQWQYITDGNVGGVYMREVELESGTLNMYVFPEDSRILNVAFHMNCLTEKIAKLSLMIYPGDLGESWLYSISDTPYTEFNDVGYDKFIASLVNDQNDNYVMFSDDVGYLIYINYDRSTPTTYQVIIEGA